MSREIKFKYIWSNPTKTNFLTEIFTLDQIERGEQFMVLENEPLLKNYRIVAILQWTGLLDKNGKEIYEGDSVQKIYKGKAYQVCEVKFNDGTFVVDDFDWEGKKFFWSLRGIQHCYIVVGNIYEHKYLLDKNQEENV